LLAGLPKETDPNLIAGREHSEDAGVYRLTDEIALIQTVDFFTPIVNDPYDFGRIAAANALSDVYAMGGRPLTAMNIACFPVRDIDHEVLKTILAGGIEKVHEAGAVLAGGHSIDDLELKYGLSVTGIAHPQKIWANSGARPGDVLILTKPLGTGVLATAVKGGLASLEIQKLGAQVMAELNKKAAEVLGRHTVHGCTDVTGFGLLGHGIEMAVGSKVTMVLSVRDIPLLPEIFDFAAMGLVPAGSKANRDFCLPRLRGAESIDPIMLDILADAQTSGGLLASVPAAQAPRIVAEMRDAGVDYAAIIGNVTEPGEGLIVLV
jgi:selenide, water dikinase